MKKAFLVLVALCFVSSLAFAQGSSGSETVMIKGDIIDNMCLDAHKTEDLAVFIKTHSKQCAITPACEASGYAIVAEGIMNKFDQDSNAKIAEFLKKKTVNLR